MSGRHLVFDGDCDPAKVNNEAEMRSAVCDLVEALGMTTLGTLSVSVPLEIEKLGRKPFEDEGGVTACAILSTSHVAVHAWPLRREIKLDVFSCRDFDPEVVFTWARERLGSNGFTSEDWER